MTRISVEEMFPSGSSLFLCIALPKFDEKSVVWGEMPGKSAGRLRPRAKRSGNLQEAFAHGRNVKETCRKVSPTGGMFRKPAGRFRPRAKGSGMLQDDFAHGRNDVKTGEMLKIK